MRPLIAGLAYAVENRLPAVFITIDSPGGEVYAGLALIQAMREANRAGVQTVCLADGYAASMAAVIFESCNVRIMTRRSALLFHPVTSGCEGNSTDIQRCLNEIIDLEKLLDIIIAQRLTIPLEELRRRANDRNYWVGWEEALAIGAVDIVEG
jgi:ATP-dependent Clp endopeptidase proteolytic subunit ClpP